MKVLFLTHQIPYPPTSGERLRSFHELRALVARGHEVHLLSFADGAREWRHQRELGGLCASVTALPRRGPQESLRLLPRLLFGAARGAAPFAVNCYASRRMRQAVSGQLSRLRPDVVVVNSTVMAQFVPDGWATRAVIDLVGGRGLHAQGRLARLLSGSRRRRREEAARLAAYEAQAVRRFACAVVTTEEEAAAFGLDEFTRRARLRVIANGVDAELYRSNVAPLRAPAERRQWLANPQSVRLVFVGSMDVEANAEGARFFAEEVFPLVRARVPHAQFLIVGHNPGPEVKRLGRIDGVVVTGSVEDVRPYLAAATVCVIPTSHSYGGRHKALEAMAAARAVVTTPAVADSIGARDGRHLLVARDASEFAAAVELLIADARLRDELAADACALAAAHDWAPLLARFTDSVEAVAARAEQRSKIEKAPGHSTLAKLRRRGI
jgi:polysaccharide biosynthesis protein PslH